MVKYDVDVKAAPTGGRNTLVSKPHLWVVFAEYSGFLHQSQFSNNMAETWQILNVSPEGRTVRWRVRWSRPLSPAVPWRWRGFRCSRDPYPEPHSSARCSGSGCWTAPRPPSAGRSDWGAPLSPHPPSPSHQRSSPLPEKTVDSQVKKSPHPGIIQNYVKDLLHALK